MQSPKVLANQIRGTRAVSRGEASASPAIQKLIAEALEILESELVRVKEDLNAVTQNVQESDVEVSLPAYL